MFGVKIDDAAKYVALISAGLYAAGFLIVNANLASYGDFDPDFASSRYVFAGFLFLWYLIPIAWLVFKYVYDLRLLNPMMKILETESRALFHVYGIQLVFLEVAVRICLSALFFYGSIDNARVNAMNNSPVLLLYAISFGITRFWKSGNLWLYQTITISLQASAFILFCFFADPALKIVAMTYFGLYVSFVFLYDPLLKKEKDFESKSTIAYFALTSLILLIAFGDNIYGKVHHQYGGGLPVAVTVYMKSDVGNFELTKSLSGGYMVDMIALNDKKLIGISGGKLAILNADNIASVIYPR